MSEKFSRYCEDAVMWSSILMYLGVWIIVSRILLIKEGGFIWLLAGGVPGIFYCAGQFYECKKYRHIYLSADPRAVPMALLGIVLVYISLNYIGNLPGNGYWVFVKMFIFSFLGGHLAAIGYTIFLTVFVFPFFKF